MRKALLLFAVFCAVCSSARAQAPAVAASTPQPGTIAAATTPPAQPPKPLTVEDRLAALEKSVSELQQTVQAIANNAVSIDAARSLAKDVVSLQDQIVAMKRSQIPPPVTKTPVKPAPKK